MTWGTQFQSCHPEKLHPAATQPWECQHLQGSSEVQTWTFQTPRQATRRGTNPWPQTVKPPRGQGNMNREGFVHRHLCSEQSCISMGCFSPLPAQVRFTPTGLVSYFIGEIKCLMWGQSEKGTAQPPPPVEYSSTGVLCTGGQVARIIDSKLWNNGVCISSPEPLN